VNLGAEATYDSDGDGVVTAGEDTGQVYPAYTVPTDKIPEREGYIFMGYQVKAYSTEYTQVAEAECWDYDRWARFRNQSLTISTNATANGVADYLDFTSHYAIAHATTATPLGSTTDAQRVVSTSPTSLEPDNGWGSETTTTCSTGGLGYTYTGTATAAPATYRYEPTEQLTTIYVNGRPYIDGQLGSQTIDGRFVTTNGFEIVDTSQFVVVQPGDQIIAVGQNQDSSGNLVDAWPNDGYGFGGTTTGQYSQDGSDGFEAPVWNVTLEPVWGKAVYYTDRTDPDRYDSATGGDLYPFVPDSLINCGADALGNTLRACRIYPGSDTDGVHNPLGAVAADQDEGWYIDDIVIEGRDYYVRAAGICSDPTLKNQDSCEVAGETWTNTVKPGFDHFQFDHYEAYLDTQLESTSVFGYVTGTKDGTVGQLQPPVAGDNCSGATCVGVDFKLQGLVTTVETTPGPHLVGDYDYNSPDTNTCSNSTYTTKATCLAAGASWNERLGDKLPNLFWGTPTETQPRNYNMPGNWNELKLLGVWRYRVKYLDRTGVTYGTGSSVTYPASNPDRITSGTDADVSWDDRNYFYWDGLWDNNGTITPAEYRVGCPLIGTGTCSGTNATGYNQLSYTIPSTAPTLTGAIFEYYQVWIDGDLITTGGTFAQDPNSGKYLPGDTIAWDLILEHGGDIELMAVWDTYTVVFHGVQNSGSGFLGKITDTQAGLAEGDLPTLPNDNQVTPTDKRAGDHSADGDHARSWVTGNGTDYVFTGRWLTNAGAAWNFTTGGVHPSNSNAVCYGPTGAIVDAQGAYYCAYTLDLWAEWDPGLYSVTFHPMGGDIAANGRNCGTSTNGATCSLYTDPTPAGDGVQYIVPSVLLDDPAHGTCSDTQYTTRATCEAATETWTPDPDYWYNVYLSMEDAFGNYAAADAHAGDNRSAWPDDPTRTGYIFDGWYLEAAYTAENDPALYDTANGHLGWDDATYAAAGGFGECHNPAYTTQTACEAAGATWTDFGSSYKIKRNYNFYAKWKKKTFDLYYDLNAGGDATAAYDTTSDWTTVGDDLKLDLTTVTAAGYDEDQQFDDLVSNAPNFTKAPTRVGYNFTHWSLDAACSPANNTAAPAAVGPVGSYRFPDIDDGNPANDPDVFTIYACWQVRQHKLIYDLNDGGDTVYPAAYSPGMAGLVDGVLRSELMDFGVLVRTAPHYTNDPAGANAPTRPKYTFTGWDLTRACQNPVADTPMPDEDKTIYACWVRLPDPDPDDEPGPSPTPGTPTPGGPSETPASTTPAGQGTTPATPAPSPSATVVAGSTLPVMGSTGAASSALLGFDVLALGLALLAKRRRMLQRAAYQRRH
ncbi:MAG: InlB B-repeat-containing protein, partial [Bifidobacteriaceae bacterium]|nr:InlB B-repeat-containing protein [Bifidobacteriaceae bacterium]